MSHVNVAMQRDSCSVFRLFMEVFLLFTELCRVKLDSLVCALGHPSAQPADHGAGKRSPKLSNDVGQETIELRLDDVVALASDRPNGADCRPPSGRSAPGCSPAARAMTCSSDTLDVVRK
jgi:hypothetical protein